MLIVMTSFNKLKIHQIDVRSTLLNGNLNKKKLHGTT
jgi:hypothetical protein